MLDEATPLIMDTTITCPTCGKHGIHIQLWSEEQPTTTQYDALLRFLNVDMFPMSGSLNNNLLFRIEERVLC